MEYLENFNIKSGRDEQHRQKAELKDYEPNKFFEEASNLLAGASSIVIEQIIPNLENITGTWNPGGFMVFPLGIHEKLGSLRLHVWPQGITRHTDQGPNIHNHSWHLISKILAGFYSDTIFELEYITELPNTENDLMRLFMTQRNPGGQDALISTGSTVKPIPIKKRNIAEGEIHNIEAGIYHLSTIPTEQLTVTLVLDSPAFAETTGVLLKSLEPQIARTRRSVQNVNALFAKEQIIRHFGLK